jgi:hypothetical protein
MKKILLGIFVLAATGCANTATQSASEPAVSKKADTKVAKNDIGYRCEKIIPTGSRIGKQFCSTKAERDKIAAHAKKHMEDGNHIRTSRYADGN